MYLCIQPLHPLHSLFSPRRKSFSSHSTRNRSLSVLLSVTNSVGFSSNKEVPVGLDAATQEKYTSLSELLHEFTSIPTIDKAWTFNSETENGSQAMFVISQPNILANKRRTSILSSHISRESNDSVTFRWAPFPTEVSGVSMMVPSPSGSKLLVVRNSVGDSPSRFEIWGPSQVKKELVVSRSIHGPLYTDGWFDGYSWNSDETQIAYVAEEPEPPKPTFTGSGHQNEGSTGSWTGQGEWEEDWGETYGGRRQPALYVIDLPSGEVCHVKDVGRSLSVGHVIWSPSIEGQRYLVFVGWPSDSRKLGIRGCYNRPCALYAVKVPSLKSKASATRSSAAGDSVVTKLTQSITNAFSPQFSPDGKFLVFLSAKSAVDSGAHSSTYSLHTIEWPTEGKLYSSLKIVEVVPVVMCPGDGMFPGLYCSKFLAKPWLSDGHTIILSSYWRSTRSIISVDILSGKVLRVSPSDSDSSWDFLALDGDNLIAVCSSPVDIPQLKYGSIVEKTLDAKWSWLDVKSPTSKCSEKAMSLLASLEFNIVKIPVRDPHKRILYLLGASKPFEAIYVSSKSNKLDSPDPLIVILHGGPHSVSLTSFSKSSAFLASLGYSLLIVNYRGSVGFGEEALLSLPGNVGSQDVSDVITAVDYAIDKGLADPSKVAVLGASHGGFLTTHLIGQALDKFAAAASKNPVCNLALMVGTSDIPDWCYAGAYGVDGQSIYTESPSLEHPSLFYSKSPVSHISKVKTPTLVLLGAKDRRVPAYNGIQYARALKEKGVETKTIVFPNDTHNINRPQSDFECLLNIGVWFNKYCR